VSEVIDFFEQVQQIDDAPATGDLLLERLEVGRLGLFGHRRDADPRLALPRRDPHPARDALFQGRVQPGQRAGVALLEVGDERLRVTGLG
jgi:hypothetical protein